MKFHLPSFDSNFHVVSFAFNYSVDRSCSLSLSGLIRARRFHPRKLCGLLFFRGVFEAVQLLLFQSRVDDESWRIIWSRWKLLKNNESIVDLEIELDGLLKLQERTTGEDSVPLSKKKITIRK
ncbi:hypothetical protein Tco_0936188 [Tanacetum coccineum]